MKTKQSLIVNFMEYWVSASPPRRIGVSRPIVCRFECWCTLRSHLSALSIEEHVHEMMIGHRPVGIKKVYDRHLYEAEKRAGFGLWEARLRGILAPRPAADVANLEEARGRRENSVFGTG